MHKNLIWEIFFQKQVLQTFFTGLKDPQESQIRAMRSDSSVQASQCEIEEDNIELIQKWHNFPNPQNNNQKYSTRRSHTPNHTYDNSTPRNYTSNHIYNNAIPRNQFQTFPRPNQKPFPSRP